MGIRTSFLILSLSSLLFACGSRQQGYTYPEIAARFADDISQFYDYHYVDWNTIDSGPAQDFEMEAGLLKAYSQNNITEPELIDEMFRMSGAARRYVHIKSLSLRSIACDNVNKAIDSLEASFTITFNKCISEPYYLRIYPDKYNETVPIALDRTIKAINQSLHTDSLTKSILGQP